MRDPIEETSEYKSIERELEALIEQRLGSLYHERPFGFCHIYWHAKKEILKERFGIDWKSPQELSPSIIFD